MPFQGPLRPPSLAEGRHTGKIFSYLQTSKSLSPAGKSKFHSVQAPTYCPCQYFKANMAAIHDPLSTEFLEKEVFDFVVVGGGTSGLVVASRLTEDPNVKVLVLEAGANRLDDPRIVTPGLAASTYDDPDFDWAFMSTSQVRRAVFVNLTEAKKILGTPKRPPTCSTQRTMSRWLDGHQPGYGDLPFQVWNECVGQVGQQGLGLGGIRPIPAKVSYFDDAI